jgi:hypothetical protein
LISSDVRRNLPWLTVAAETLAPSVCLSASLFLYLSLSLLTQITVSLLGEDKGFFFTYPHKKKKLGDVRSGLLGGQYFQSND